MAKILVIDDERSIRSTLKEILEYEKYEVDLAESGKEGMELFESGKYDIILCDIKMPEMDGIEVLEKIFEKSEDEQVIMISGHGNIDTALDMTDFVFPGFPDVEQHRAFIFQLCIQLRRAHATH